MNPDDLLEEDDEGRFGSLLSLLTGNVPEAAPEQAPAAAAPAAPPPAPTRTAPPVVPPGSTDPHEQGHSSAMAQPQSAEDQTFDRDIRELKQREAAAGTTRGELWRRRILGGLLGGLGQSQDAIRGALGPSGQERQAAVRALITQRTEQRQAQQQARQERLAQMLEARRRQGNEDRNFELRRQATESLVDRRDELGTEAQARLDLGRERLGLAQDQFEWRQSQADIDREARERRARIIAGQHVGPGDSGDGGMMRPGGAPQGVGAPTANPDSLVIQSIIDTRRDQIMPAAEAEAQRLRAEGIDASPDDIAWDMAANFFSRLPRKQQNAIRQQYAAPPSSTSEGGQHDRTERTARGHVVPGWTRAPDAPELNASERANARGIAAAVNVVGTLTRRMESLAQEIGRLEAAGGDAGVISQRVAEARATHEMIINKLRELGNYGVPQDSELARMEQLAPRISAGDVRFLVGSVPAVYRQMRGVVTRSAEDEMRALGFTRGDGGGGARATQYSAGQQVVIRGRTVRLTQAQADALNRRGGAQ